MTVKVKIGGQLLFPLTSPPSKPKPAPENKLVAKVLDYEDRKIVVTIPFPDTVELVAQILNETQLQPDHSQKSQKLKYQQLDEDIIASLSEAPMGGTPFVTGGSNPAKTKAAFRIGYDEGQPLNWAQLTLWRTQGDDFGYWQVRLQFSASKAGPAGLVKLIAGLEAALPFLDVSKLIAAFKVSRVDAAIDCIGASPLDLIAHVTKPGKRMVFVGSKGRPESVYFYERKKPLSSPPQSLSVWTRGPHRLTLYERRDYHRQLMLDPPYGDCPVTRVEVPMRWTNARPSLSKLPHLKNLLKGKRVAYAPAAPGGGGRTWRQFCMAAFGAGVDQALFGWVPGPGAKFATAYEGCPGDLVSEVNWPAWVAGLEHTGLAAWVKLAEDGE
jgi:hypothetical protein